MMYKVKTLKEGGTLFIDPNNIEFIMDVTEEGDTHHTTLISTNAGAQILVKTKTSKLINADWYIKELSYE